VFCFVLFYFHALHLTLGGALSVTVCIWGPPAAGEMRAGPGCTLLLTWSLASALLVSGSESHKVHRMQDFDGKVVQVRDVG
jgi:hypothetical protein